jgi:hypothetical protein
LPADTVLDDPGRDPRLSDGVADTLKAALLLQPQVPELRAQGLTDTEIVDAMMALMTAGMFELVQDGDRICFVPTGETWTTVGIALPVEWDAHRPGAQPRRRPRRRHFRP